MTPTEKVEQLRSCLDVIRLAEKILSKDHRFYTNLIENQITLIEALEKYSHEEKHGFTAREALEKVCK